MTQADRMIIHLDSAKFDRMKAIIDQMVEFAQKYEGMKEQIKEFLPKYNKMADVEEEKFGNVDMYFSGSDRWINLMVSSEYLRDIQEHLQAIQDDIDKLETM